MDVELRDIHKIFGTLHANDGINLIIPAGTIQGILGENGAGKSTLMKVLSGFITADQGEIYLGGKQVRIQSPADSIRQGIGMLHQDPLDFPPMKVLDNFLIGRGSGLLPKWGKARGEFLELAKQFDFSLDPDAYVDSLTVGERQQLEILRLLWLGVSVLILDEPTTGISALQKERLFATLKILASQGKTIIFVSHKLEDVENLCSRVAVLRQGKLVGEMVPPYDIDGLVAWMFGKVLTFGGRESIPPGDCILVLDHISLEDQRLKITDVDLSVCGGEVIGLAGMEGSGQSLFLQACAGLVRTTSGHIRVGKRDLSGKPHLVFKQAGVAFLPAARLEEGLVPGLTLTDHFVLAEPPQGIFIDRPRCGQLTLERIQVFNIKGTPASQVESLSGGNQQRALLALLRDPLSLVLLEHPTRGLDVESTMYIWSKLKERCRQGTAILFISSDLDEILQYSDRVLVFFAGKVSPSLDASALSVDALGQLIGGKGWEQFEQEATHV